MRRRRLHRGLAAVATMTLATGVFATSAAAADDFESAANVVYVATDGDDANDGSIQDPLATITAARDALAGKTSAEAPGTVWVRGGTYVLDDTIALTGEENSWVTYAAYGGEDVDITGAHALSGDGWQRLEDADLGAAEFSSSTRLPSEVRQDVWVYDLGAAGVDPGTLYKNGFNWLPQPFAPELAVDGSIQTLAEYPNGDDCTTSQTDCHLWGSGGKWGAEGPKDLTQIDLDERFAPQSDWERSGTTPRAQFEDKKQQLPEGESRDTWSQEEMRKMTPSIFQVGGRALADDRYQSWAPEAVPTVHDWGTRGFGDYADVPVQADPEWIDGIDNTRYETEGWLSGYIGNNYAIDMVRMLSWSDGTLYTKYASMYIPQEGYTKVKATNVLAELDVAGEYYIDRHEGNDILYYLPDDGSVEGKDITLSAFDKNFFLLDSTTSVTIRDLGMSESLVSGIQLLDAHATLIDGVEISNVSMDAIRIGETTESITALPDYETVRGGTENVVRNSYLHDLGGGGVLLGGGDRSTLERGDNVAHHNEIARFSKLATYTPAGYLYGVGNSFEHNEVYDAPHMAVQIMGNDMRVNHNEFRDLVKNAGDQGVVYTGRDYTYLGNEIAYNLFDGVGGKNDAFYMDDGVSGMRFHHNVIKDSHSGVFFQSGHSNTANDNVFIDVAQTGHDQQYASKGEESLPVSNAWVVQSRFNSFLDVREGEKYSATPETVATWKDHYTSGGNEYSDGAPIVFPEIEDWYLPQVTDAGTYCVADDYATEATNGCDRAAVWEDPDSLYVPARIQLDHSVIIGGGEFSGSTVSFAEPDASYSLSTWSEKINTNIVKPESTDTAGFDLETLKFSSTGEVAMAFGAEWIDTWNSQVTAEGIGRPDPSDEQPPVPGASMLSHDNANDGINGGSFTVTVNMWWGQNGTAFRLFENGVLVNEVALEDVSPNAQRIEVPISGKVNGEYRYTCELVNVTGATPCVPITVTVDAASPGVPVLSHDNHDRDGAYGVTADMWWGTNATSWSLTEDGVEVANGALDDRSPSAQNVRVPLADRNSGRHVYVMTFTNPAGSTESEALTVEVW